MQTKRRALGQVVLCKGCCCGRTDRGLPEVPVDRIKEIWKREKLNASIQLTISGCLGPCDLPNVVLVIMGDQMEWLGLVEGDEAYSALVKWSRDCDEAGAIVPLPESLAKLRFDRFKVLEAVS